MHHRMLDDSPTKRQRDRLVAEAHPKDRNPMAQRARGGDEASGDLGAAWSRTQHDEIGTGGKKAGGGGAIGRYHRDLGTQHPERLGEVMGE